MLWPLVILSIVHLPLSLTINRLMSYSGKCVHMHLFVFLVVCVTRTNNKVRETNLSHEVGNVCFLDIHLVKMGGNCMT